QPRAEPPGRDHEGASRARERAGRARALAAGPGRPRGGGAAERHSAGLAPLTAVASVSNPPAVPDVLVVEDKESLRGMLRKTLESRGLTVVEAGDAYEARRRLQLSRVLVVLTDLKLPAG